MVADVPPRPQRHETPVTSRHVRDVQHTTCCIVGAGPAGAVVALLLARRGIPVLLLDAHINFDRDFRGNTLSPAVMQVMAQIGLAERVLQLRHAKIATYTVRTAKDSTVFADFTRLKTCYPFVTMLPQVDLLNLVTAEARRFAHFHLVMGARMQELIEEEGEIRGVRYQSKDGWHEVRAALTVGADGRFSRTRRLAGLEPVVSAAPLDVLWFYLPRRPEDPAEAGASFRLGPGGLLTLMEHFDHWQVGYIIAKGTYSRIRAAGLSALREAIEALAPELSDRVQHLQSWQQCSLLAVESSRLRRWYRPGLLLIGDAAHTMSPVGGVGINYAIHDAVAAAHALAGPLRTGQLRLRDLQIVQRQREWPTRVIQTLQMVAHWWIVGRALSSNEPVKLGPVLRLCLRLPWLRTLTAWLMAFDLQAMRVQHPISASFRRRTRAQASSMS